MKKMAVVMAGALFLVFAGIVSVADAQVVGPIMDEEYFPQMAQKAPSCKTAYDTFLKTAEPLNACRSLAELNMKISAQQEVIKDMNATKGCRECKRTAMKATETVGAYREQANVLKAQCPDKKQQYELAMSLDKKHKQVCKSCKNQWPGELGPYGMNPCN